MIASLKVKCPYCGKSVHSYDAETGAIHLDADTAPDGKPCPHLVYGIYMQYSDDTNDGQRLPSYSADDDWLCPALSKLVEADADFLSVFLGERVHGGHEYLGRDLRVPLTAPYQLDDEEVAFLGGKEIDPYDPDPYNALIEQSEELDAWCDEILSDEDDSDASHDGSEVVGEGGVFGQRPTFEGAQALLREASNDPQKPKPNAVPQDKVVTVRSCVLWSQDPAKLLSELYRSWQLPE